jgi:hypothetical protein
LPYVLLLLSLEEIHQLGVDDVRMRPRDIVRPMVETYPLENASQAYERMMSGKVRFRAVLTMTGARIRALI